MSRLTDFDAYIQSAMPTWDCPGVALAIVRGEEVLQTQFSKNPLFGWS